MFEEFVINRFLFDKNLSVSFLCKYSFFLENVILHFHFFVFFYYTTIHVKRQTCYVPQLHLQKLAYNKRYLLYQEI